MDIHLLGRHHSHQYLGRQAIRRSGGSCIDGEIRLDVSYHPCPHRYVLQYLFIPATSTSTSKQILTCSYLQTQ